MSAPVRGAGRAWHRRAAAARRAPVGLLLLAAVAAGVPGTPHGGSAVPAGSPGGAGTGDPLFPSLGNGGYDVTHYGLALHYVPDSNHLKGTARVTARATQHLSRFNLDLTGLTVRSAMVDGSRAGFTRRKDELTVTPARTIEKGATFTVSVRYDGTPREIRAGGDVEGWVETDDGSTALGQPTGSTAWFPGNHHPSDKAAYDISVTVPKDDEGDPYDALANGELVEVRDQDDRVTSHWRVKQPMAGYLANVSVGYFEITRDRTAAGVPVLVAVDPDQSAKAERVKDLVPRITEWASRRFGPYPFASTGAVVDHVPRLDYALETQTRPYFDEAPGEQLLVHELAHQWFGNSVTPRRWKDMWLNEGFATYAEWLWEEEHGGRTAQEIFASFYDGTHEDSGGIWDFAPADPPSAARVSDAPVYGRGAMVVHKLREAVGDATFFHILRAWTREHRYGNASTRQLIALSEETSGKDLSALFDTWLFAEKKPSTA
ncbi:M1 family metallopeptidase [Streptomyces sp. NPDC047108]|uniref:M1 family metallopeptidase n=1 Tax=Streptomyces sp. NPDC047108 TaxID=3155025 RepID=UPI0033EDB166